MQLDLSLIILQEWEEPVQKMILECMELIQEGSFL